MKIKAIIVDLDRTLLRSDKTISPYTAEVLKYCQSRGIKVLVATARPWRTMEAFLQVIPFDAQTVSNGARILCGEEKKEFPICIGDVERILKVLRVKDTLKVTLETGEVAYSNLPVEEYETILTEDLLDRAKEEGALKILVHLEDPGDLEIIKEHLPKQVCYTIAHGTLLQIQNQEATKWNGVRTMLEFIGCLPEEAIYFGDDWDDIQSIQKCGLGIAMGNALAEVKDEADDVTETNDDDGVARYLERYLLDTNSL